jgi:PleD family two-component response regulator
MADITVNRNSLELSLEDIELNRRSRDATTTNYIFLQGFEILSNHQKAQLDSLDVQIQEYISDKTYLCRYTGNDLETLRALPFVRVVNAYHRSLKTSADLKATIEQEGPENLFTVDLMLHRDAETSPEALADRLVDRNIAQEADVKAFPESNKVRVTVAGSAIKDLENFDDVNRIVELETIGLANSPE